MKLFVYMYIFLYLHRARGNNSFYKHYPTYRFTGTASGQPQVQVYDFGICLRCITTKRYDAYRMFLNTKILNGIYVFTSSMNTTEGRRLPCNGKL